MGQQCIQHASLGEPAKLSRYNKSKLCGPCQRRGYTLADVPTTVANEDLPGGNPLEGKDEWLTECGKPVTYFQGPVLWCEECRKQLQEGKFPRVCEPWDSDSTSPEQRYEELFRAARALFDAGINDEDRIVATLVFAARFWEYPYLRQVRDKLVEASEGGEAWSELTTRFYNSFGNLEALGIVDGVLVIRQVPIEATSAVNEETGVVEEISTEVFKRRAKPKDVASLYEQSLMVNGIPYDTDRGEISWKVYPGCIRIMARPENYTIDPIGKHLMRPRPEKHQRPFPHPRIVGGMYEILRGSKSEDEFEGFSYVLAGSQRGPRSQADTLIPACVAWYIGGRGKFIEREELRPKVVRLLNERLLEPCGKTLLTLEGWRASRPIWKDAQRFSQLILSIDHELREHAPFLGTRDSNKFF